MLVLALSINVVATLIQEEPSDGASGGPSPAAQLDKPR
jgi:hypothetical protein